MADDNWQKVREIFDSALCCKPEERQNFVVEACGADESLLVEVESLFASLDSAESFMEKPAVAAVAEAIEIEKKKFKKGQNFGHYRIIKSIGAGGMGEVYLAQDERLDRKVAVKILNPEFSRHEANLQRFIREAKAASALNHPNILVIHEIGEADDINFIVSEYVKGKTLRENLCEKTLEITEVLDISSQVANALVAAHEAKIVHRDIKPENIMIRPDGFIKVLDFGLAKLVHNENKSILGLEDSKHQTAKGVILGTVNYMSPEQAKGERVDERTDIFSLGVLIYEMIAGQTPFQGNSQPETFANVINQEPAPLEKFVANVPDELQKIVLKMLRKKSDERYFSMKAVFADLKVFQDNLSLTAKMNRADVSVSRITKILQVTTDGAEKPNDEQILNLELSSTTPNTKKTEVETQPTNFLKTTKRRKGMIRGLKFLFCGIGVGFLFLIIMKVLQIVGVASFQYGGTFSGANSSPLPDMIGELLTMLIVPVLLSYFVGIGLFLFGFARIIYALFEKEDSGTNTLLIERIMTGIIVLIILAVGIPNTITSYREASKASELREISVGNKKSIAVLPLKPINTASRDEIYEFGIADSLIHRLGTMKEFFVRPLSATRKYADIEQDPIAAGKEQKVDFVVASNYQIADGRIRVTAQLINVVSGQIEETKIIEKDAGNIFAAQDAIAGEVGNLLMTRFAIVSNRSKTLHGTTNEEAYRLFLHGKNLTNQRSVEDARKAVEYFEQAIRLDPNFARGYAGLARAYLVSAGIGNESFPNDSEKAKKAVEKAFELDNNLADAYVARADLTLKSANLDGTEKDLLRALELEPNNDAAHWLYSLVLAYRGRMDEAFAEIETTLAIAPGTPMYLRDRGRFLYYARRYDEAITQLEQVIELDKDHGTVYGWLWLSYELKGDYAGAYRTFINWQKRTNLERTEIYQKTYETDGWLGVRRKMLEFDNLNEQKPGNNLFAMARNCALIGDKEKAFEYLNTLIEKRQWRMVMLNAEPSLDSLRDDPRFDELVRRVGLK